MAAEHLRLIIVVYTSAIAPLLLMLILRRKKLIPDWVPYVYLASFIACAIGWELWFTYGWVDGAPVYERRSATLNTYLPFHVNWLLNSLADAGTICLGGLLLLHLSLSNDSNYLTQWRWSAFTLLLIWFIGQNVFVEMYLYHDQLAVGKALSWAPFAPTGPWFNPVLFEFNGRTITLQGQLPWLIMTPLFYAGLIRHLRA
ncbi:MAG TPA: hypothetical protein DCW52_07855 [Gammaproteobacteria bacterium]|jgi:hypothetical protein|nr:hypothetical protein [Gammaproteobacteria bacterium]